jgi:YidC/Oxa1 family membrane protein insertase
MDYQRIFILLGLAVTAYMLILAWNEDYGQGSERPVQPVEEEQVITSEGVDTALPEPAAAELATGSDDVPELAEEKDAASVKAPSTQRQLIVVDTDVLRIHIDPLGGDVVRAALPRFPESLDTPDIPYLLLDPRNDYVAQSGLIGPNGTDRPGYRPLFETDHAVYDLGDGDSLNVPLRYRQADGALVTKTFVFRRGDYLIDIEYEVTAATSSTWRGGLFAQIKRDSQDPHAESSNIMGLQPYVGGATRSEQELYDKLTFDDLEEESYKLGIAGGYIAMVQHYFVSAWVPADDRENTYQARKLKGQDVYFFGFTTPALSINAGETGRLAARFYVGPKDQYRLQEIAEGLDLTVDYGFLWWLAQPLFYLLTAIHSVVANWGLAIICLTIIVKSLLYPLSAASFRSMAKMRKLQPEMAKLKERYGDDRQQFSQAMMDLYKKEGANPLGGCLPILLQMPVFLALYWTLMESVELRQAPFMLWITDLSAMDPYFILPILMGISMFLTQMLQPEPPDPVQAKVFKMMPIMFTFFFLWFPSGLVLYWLVNNILSIMQQWYVTRQIEKAG